MPRSIPEVQALLARFPVSAANYPIYQALLTLPWDVYKPILDMLFDGRLFPEDLVDAPEQARAGSRGAADSAGAAALLAEAAALGLVSPGALLQRALALLGGRAPTLVPLARDGSAANLLPDGTSGGYAPASTLLAGTQLDLIAPNPIELLRSGDLQAAQKAAQQRLVGGPLTVA